MNSDELDETDRGIIHLLQQNARNYSAADIAEKVGVTANTVQNRISRLQERGIIKGYVPLLDYEQAGFQLKVIRNAVEHGDDDVNVTVGTSDDGFYVEDDGSGIPEDDRDKVFDVGYSSSDEGTGYGLAIVKRIADAHGWQIRVTGSADDGAQFEITDVEFVAE